MSGRGAGGQRCQLILQRCLAIHLSKPGNAPEDFWMYDSGYLLFQMCFREQFPVEIAVCSIVDSSAFVSIASKRPDTV
ncbi:unnamed protein product, partial [Iphiclides podalirius]